MPKYKVTFTKPKWGGNAFAPPGPRGKFSREVTADNQKEAIKKVRMSTHILAKGFKAKRIGN